MMLMHALDGFLDGLAQARLFEAMASQPCMEPNISSTVVPV
jgi:hypothetical protein